MIPFYKVKSLEQMAMGPFQFSWLFNTPDSYKVANVKPLQVRIILLSHKNGLIATDYFNAEKKTSVHMSYPQNW